LKLNHTNLCASHVCELTHILARHFDFEVVVSGKVPQAGGPIAAGSDFAMLRGSDGFSLVITEMAEGSTRHYPTNFHLGFMVETPDEVHAKHRELTDAGCHPGPINTFEAMGADWTAFYCPVGDGIELEVNASVRTSRGID
jgi:hypothetical protein